MTIAAIRSCLNCLGISCISLEKVVTPLELWQELEQMVDRKMELYPGQRLILTEIDVDRYLEEFERSSPGSIEVFDSKVALKYKLLIAGDDFKFKAVTLFSAKRALMIESSTPLEVSLERR